MREFTRQSVAVSQKLARTSFFVVLTLVSLISVVNLKEPKIATAASSSNLNFQARLLNSAGNVVPDGYYNIEFNLYSASSGGSTLWTDTRYDQNGGTAGLDYRLRVVNGYMSVNLGDTSVGGTAFPGSINWDQELWLTMNIGGSTQTATPTWDGEMSPRLKLTAVPYAFKAGQLAKTTSGNVSTLDFAAQTGARTILLPDESGTVCLQGSTSCNFAAASGSSSYIQNGTSLQSNANFNIQSAADGSVTATLRARASQTADILQVRNSADNATLLAIGSNGNLTLSGPQLTNNGATLNTANSLGDFASGGSIGSAASTVDIYTSFAIAQTTASQVLSLASPTSATAGRVVYVFNTGSTSFTMHSVSIPAGYGQIYVWNGTAWILGASGGGAAITLQSAYDGGNTLTTTDAKDVSITLANTATDSNYIVNIAASSTGLFKIQNNGTDVLEIGSAGRLELDVQGSGGGLLIGGDANLYRGAADTLQTSDALTVGGLITGSAGATVSGATISLNGSSNFATNINTGTSTGAVSIGNTLAGAVTLQSASGINLGTGGVANTIQIGNTTGAVAQTINIGNNATASSTNTVVIGSIIGTSPVTLQSGTSGIAASSTATTGTALAVTANSLTTGTGLNLTSTSSSRSSGNLLSAAETITYTGVSTRSGSVANISRAITAGTPSSVALDSSSSSYSSSWSHTIGSGSNRAVFVTAGTHAGSTPTATFNGTSMTAVTSLTNGSVKAYIFQILEASLPAAGTYTIAVTNGDSNGMHGAVSFANVDQSTPTENATSSTTNTVTVTNSSGNYAIDSLGTSTFEVITASGSGQVQFTGEAGNWANSKGSYNATSASATFTWDNSAVKAHVGVSVRKSPTAVTVTGAAANISSNCTVTSGSCTDSGNILNLQQSYASATGTVLNVQNAGTGAALGITQTGSSTIDIQLGMGNIQTANSTTSTVVNLQSGTASAGASGAVTVRSGTGTTGSGILTLQSGNASAGTSGASTMTTGTGTTGSGTLALNTGNASAGTSGTISVISGTGTTATGALTVRSGNASAGTSGTLTVSTGTGTTASGAISLTSGNASAGTAGNVTIDVGTSSSGSGSVNIGTTNALTTTIGRSGGTVVANGSQLTNNGSTLNTSSALGDLAAGALGIAAATVDVKTSFTISPTAGGRTYTIPSPTTTTAGRIIYINNINGSNSFIIGSATFAPGATASYIWDGTAWRIEGIDTGVTTIGTIDSQTKSADGAVISGTSLVLQTADATYPGLISATTQTIAGAKTFTGASVFSSAGTALSVTNDASIGGTGTIGTLSVTNAATIGTGLTVTSGGAGITGTTNINTTGANATTLGNSGSTVTLSGGTNTIVGTTNINTTGTANTSIGNATGTLALTSSTFNLTTAGAVSGVTGYAQASGTFLQSGSGTFGTGTGAVSLNGATSVTGSNTFSVGTGVSSFGGNISQTGTTTLSTGTGAVSLNGDTTIASNKTFTANGTALFKSATDSTTAFQIQNAAGSQLFSTDTTNSINTLYGSGTRIQQNVSTNATLIYDDFNRSSLGGSWTNRSGTFDINSNRARLTAVIGGGIPDVSHYNSIVPSSADYTVQADVNFNGMSQAATNFACVVGRRVNDGATDSFGYYLCIDNNAGRLKLYSRHTGPGYTELGTNYLIPSYSASTTYTIKLGMVGTALTAYLDGVSRISTTDATYSAAGDAAISSANGSGLTGQTWDNFVVTSSSTSTVFQILNGSGTSLQSTDSSGNTIFRTATNSTTGLQVQNSSGTSVLNIDTTNGRIGINTTAASGDLTFGENATRTINVQTRTTNAVGSALTISAGAAGSGASAFAGGALTLQGGAAGGTGNANGGGITIAGGAAVGTGTQGIVNLSTSAFTSGSVQTFASSGTFPLTAGNVDLYSSLPVTASTTSVIVTVPDPAQSVIGRVLYIAARSGSSDFTLRLNATRTPIDIAMKQNSTATLIWNGTDWTAAGASSSTDLQSAYNNTLTSAGGAELVLNAPGGNADGLTIRNNATTPITGGILEVQTSIGSNLFSVNNNATEYATNGGAETQGASASTFPASTWIAAPAGGTVSRNTTAANNATGTASVSVVTTTTSHGAADTLSAALTANLQYTASFTVKGATNFSTLDVIYSRDGTNTATTSCATAKTVTTSIWSRITCTFTAPSSGITSSNAIFIRQSDATGRTFYIDNLSVNVNASVNHGADGSVDSALGTNWTDFGTNGGGTTTVVRNTSIIYDTSGSVEKTTGATATKGIRNNMTITPSVSTQYLVTFYGRSSNTFTDVTAGFLPAGGDSAPVSAQLCTDYNTQTLSTTGWTKITCIITTPSSGISDPDVVIYQPTATARTFYVDALTVTLNTNTASNVQIGQGNKGGPTTLFTLDRSSTAPIAENNDAYLGSMYYDTTSGRIQCYEADGWGACGAAPDNIVNLNPEFAGAVLNGSGVGTMSADFCGNGGGLSVNTSLCSSGQARNYYKWTSPQATQQTYSIYVTYQLPASFKNFASDDTVQLTARTDNTTNGVVTYEMFKNESGAISACGTETTVTSTVDTWQTVGVNGNESTGCSFTTSSANAFVIFKINVKANTNANVYVGTLSFTTSGR